MIPRTLVQFWNTPDMPSAIEALVDSWRTANPAFEHRLFDRDAARAYIAEHHGERCAGLFASASLPAMQSDIFRIAFCLHEGGVYADAASRCERGIDSLLGEDERLVLMRKWHGGVCNGFIAAPAGHPSLELIWQRIVANMSARSIPDVWRATGPGLYNSPDVIGDESLVRVEEQAVLKGWLDLVNELSHKKEGQHWSERQQGMDIYAGVPGDTPSAGGAEAA